MGIGQFLTMPIFFASNAIYPITLMPAWLQAIARVNPLSYEVDVGEELPELQRPAADACQHRRGQGRWISN